MGRGRVLVEDVLGIEGEGEVGRWRAAFLECLLRGVVRGNQSLG